MAKECKGCGKCCMTTDHVDVHDEDLKKWKGTFLESHAMINEMDDFGAEPELRKVIAKLIKKHLPDHKPIEYKCPFIIILKGFYGCFLHTTFKPKMCRDFNSGSKHAKEFCSCPA